MSDENEKTPEGQLLSNKQISEIKQKAQAKVIAKRKLAEEERLLKQFMDEEERASGLQEPMESIFIDLPEFCDAVRIDGVTYFQGHSYTVPQSRGDVIREMMNNTLEHQAQIDGKPENYYRKSRGQHVGPNGAQSNILRV